MRSLYLSSVLIPREVFPSMKEQVCVVESLLRVQGLRKSFGQVEVLQGLSFDLRAGEFFTLLGSSGCGKTTTLRIIAGLEHPDEGSVLLDGADITSLPPNLRPLNTVFQNYALFPTLDVYHNVAYGLTTRHVPRDQVDREVHKALELVHLPGYESRRPDELSGGQRQRVAIARAVVLKPRVLLFDEPLGALDLKLRKSMQHELKRLQEELGISFVYVTHDQEEALAMSDRIGIVNKGRFEQIGTPEEVYSHPANRFVADFVGESNFVPVRVSGIEAGDTYRVDRGSLSLSARVLSGEVVAKGDLRTLSVRPERVRISSPREDGLGARGSSPLVGTIVSQQFLGSIFRTRIAVSDDLVLTSVQTTTPEASVGQKVLVNWDAADATLLSSEVSA